MMFSSPNDGNFSVCFAPDLHIISERKQQYVIRWGNRWRRDSYHKAIALQLFPMENKQRSKAVQWPVSHMSMTHDHLYYHWKRFKHLPHMRKRYARRPSISCLKSSFHAHVKKSRFERTHSPDSPIVQNVWRARMKYCSQLESSHDQYTRTRLVEWSIFDSRCGRNGMVLCMHGCGRCQCYDGWFRRYNVHSCQTKMKNDYKKSFHDLFNYLLFDTFELKGRAISGCYLRHNPLRLCINDDLTTPFVHIDFSLLFLLYSVSPIPIHVCVMCDALCDRAIKLNYVLHHNIRSAPWILIVAPSACAYTCI